MQIPFYDTRITDDFNTMLVKEKSVYCGVKILDSPKLITEMLNEVVSLNVLGEEHCYMLALNTKSIVIGIFLISKGTVNVSDHIIVGGDNFYSFYEHELL